MFKRMAQVLLVFSLVLTCTWSTLNDFQSRRPVSTEIASTGTGALSHIVCAVHSLTLIVRLDGNPHTTGERSGVVQRLHVHLEFHPTDHTPLAAVNELTSRVASHSPRLQDPRLLLPTPQNLETIKKVAQILIMLGEQVIPGVIGQTPPSAVDTSTSAEIPNDQFTNE